MSDRFKQTLAVLAGAAGMSVDEFERRQIALHSCTENGRAVASVVFYRAGEYWPDFFDLSDQVPLAAWASMFDQFQPFVTPDIAEQAVDAVHASGVAEPHVGVFLRAAADILRSHTDG